MKTVIATLGSLAVLAMVAGCSADTTESEPVGSTESAVSYNKQVSHSVKKQLDEVRKATAKYKDVNVAYADGFINADEETGCTNSPAGTEGFHFINFDRLGAPNNTLEPPILLYTRDASGKYILAGVEYLQWVIVNDDVYFGDGRDLPPESKIAPRLFDRDFDGPMAGHTDDMPWHFDLHVWLWAGNDAGVFQAWNTSMVCE